jgi:hypothetical protein
MVRAKFYVSTLTKQKMGQQGEIGTVVKLNSVLSGSDENKEFYRYTPSGTIELGTLNETAAAQFTIGQEFYVDFTAAN